MNSLLIFLFLSTVILSGASARRRGDIEIVEVILTTSTPSTTLSTDVTLQTDTPAPDNVTAVPSYQYHLVNTTTTSASFVLSSSFLVYLLPLGLVVFWTPSINGLISLKYLLHIYETLIIAMYHDFIWNLKSFPTIISKAQQVIDADFERTS